MKKRDVVTALLPRQMVLYPACKTAEAFAPTNIALCKYWGKRDGELNLPVTSSLSVALLDKGASVKLSLHDKAQDHIILNSQVVPADTAFSERMRQFLDLFRVETKWSLQAEITMNLPVAAGLASSACGFASLVLALNDLFGWQLTRRELSILARLGSGSATRSFWPGFVEWYAGTRADGMDSYGEPLEATWPELCIGIVTLSDQPKPISSRVAMQRTVDTSALYAAWPNKVANDLALIKQAILEKNFPLFGRTAESNALTMHATMLSNWPPVCYCLPATLACMQKIWALRQEGLALYFTQDAGPNLKLLFQAEDLENVKKHFPEVEGGKGF